MAERKKQNGGRGNGHLKPGGGQAGTEARYDAFAEAYVRLKLNGTEAAKAAGYSPKTAAEQASRLLGNAQVQGRIRRLLAPRLERLEVSADRVLQELAKLAFSNVADFTEIDPVTRQPLLRFPDPGSPEYLNLMAAVQSIEQEAVPGQPALRTKFKLADKKAALDTLAKVLRLVVDRVEHTGAGGAPLLDLAALLEGSDQAERDAVRGMLERQRDRLTAAGAAGEDPGDIDHLK